MQNQTVIYGVLAVPAIVGLVQVAKTAGLPPRFAPAAALAFGILAGLAQLAANRWTWVVAVAAGVAMGLSASGLYSGAQAVISRGTPDAARLP